VKTRYDDAGSSIVLHATAEFCRTLGDIPSLAAENLYGDEEMVNAVGFFYLQLDKEWIVPK